MSKSPPLRSATSAAESRPPQLAHLPPPAPAPAFSAGQNAYGRPPSQTPSIESQRSRGYAYNQADYQRSEHPETREMFQQPYRSPGSFPRPSALPPQTLPSMSQALPQHTYLPASTSLPSSGLPMTNQPPATESSTPASPKSQRKAKGHVASACVPCKRAHLRCDAQRPCSRCLSNGKEDACVDVQHKKRGRPRLRDDRETRYEVSRGPASQHDPGLGGPTNAYAPGSGAAGPGYDIPLHHAQQQRLAKPDPRDSIPARYRPPLSIATQTDEPVAYLTLGLQFLRVSDPFREAMGGLGDRRSLHDVVVLGDRDRVLSLQGDLMAEQKQMEPNYLPPILDRGDQVLGRHGFSARDVSAFNLNRQEYFGFVIGDGKWRQYPVRLGLGKEGSYFFVVMALAVMSNPHTPSPHERQPGLYGSSMPSQPPPGSMAHDLHRHRLSEGSTQPRPILSSAPPLLGSQSEGLSPIGYPLSTSRPEYTGPPSFRASQSDSSYQLPPIRSQPPRDDKTGWGPGRSGRVDIGGLIERPEGPGRP